MKIKTFTSGKLNNNTYMICNDDTNECIIIDAAASLEDVKPRVEGYKVLAVLLTHGHYDHFVNLETYMAFYDIKCYVSAADLEKLYNPKQNYSIVFNTFKTCREPRENFVVVEDKQKIQIGPFEINAFLTKGHTDGSLTFEIENNLFTGDTKFLWNCGRTDLITGNEEDMQKSIQFLNTNFVGCEFYPGHGKSGKI